jgi:ABC-type polysaccharide transport system, permease component
MITQKLKPSIKVNNIGYGAMLIKDFKKFKLLYLMVLPVIMYYIIFCYIPMYGSLIAFQDFNLTKGIFGSEWIGFRNFIDFFTGPYFSRTLRNALLLNIYALIFVFPTPIIFALLLNEISCGAYKKVVQTISYLPYFISMVVVTGIILDFTSSHGMVTYLYKLITNNVNSMNLLTQPEVFRPIYIISEIWQYMGFNSIIYICALSGINPELYEAATIDGANRWKRMINITLAGLKPTIVILFILQLGSIMNVGFDKIFLLYNPSIYETSDVIATYVYRQGLLTGNYSFASAVGIFNSVVNLIILICANSLSRKVNEVSLF